MARQPLILHPQPLTKAAFQPFGEVIEIAGETPVSINEGTTQRYHDLANVDVATAGGRPLINIFRGQPRPRPIEIAMMERHPLGSQAFFPLQGLTYLLVVAKPSSTVTAADLSAFVASGNQGVNYHRAVWHHPLLVLRENQDFLVFDRGGSDEDENANLQEIWFSEDARAKLVYDPTNEPISR